MEKQGFIGWVKFSELDKILTKFLHIFFWIMKKITLIDDLNKALQKVVLMVDNCQKLEVLDNHFEHKKG